VSLGRGAKGGGSSRGGCSVARQQGKAVSGRWVASEEAVEVEYRGVRHGRWGGVDQSVGW